MLRNRDELDGLLKQAIAEGVRWPIERPSLSALSELGLSVEQIARYFSIDPVEVRAFLKPKGNRLGWTHEFAECASCEIAPACRPGGGGHGRGLWRQRSPRRC